LDPDVVARLATLEFRTRDVVDGLIAGRHQSRFRGGSAEFAQHRSYAAGDDLRYLDWKVWAKSDRLYVREFEEETNLRASILADASASMAYGEGDRNKFLYASQLLAAMAYLLLRQSDAVSLMVFDQSIRTELPARNQLAHWKPMLTALASTKPARRANFDSVVGPLIGRDTRRSLVMIASDLFVEPDSLAKSLRLLRSRRHDVIVFHVLHPDEMTFPFDAMTRFEGLEDRRELTCQPRALRQGYLAALKSFLADTRRACGQVGADYRLAVTSEPVDAVLASLLHERLRA
jgi:uncharacterized protein (DUF58 family)